MVKRSDGRWQEVVTINGKRKYFYGKNKSEVMAKIRAYKETASNAANFDVVADEWWEEHEPALAYNTAKSYKPAKIRAANEFKSIDIAQITPQQIASYIGVFAKSHAEKTVKTQLMVFNLIFRYAVEHGYALVNVARDLSVPKNLPKKKITSPTPEDIQRVKQSTNCTFGMFAFWAMYTGLRRGELLALEWKDVDLKNKAIHVTKSLYHDSNVPKVKVPKTKTSIGDIPILDVLAKKIKTMHPKKGIVFANENGGYLSETQFQRQWELYTKESGVTATPHQFRHAYATMLYEAGIPPEEMQILLRHAQLSTTMNIYTDIRDNKIKSVHSKVYSIDIK